MSQVIVEDRPLDVVGLRGRTAAANANLATTLDELAAQLAAEATAENGSEFANLIELSRSALGLDDMEMSRLLRVSRPTIGRWIRRDASPHRIGRKAICEVLAKTAVAQAKARRG